MLVGAAPGVGNGLAEERNDAHDEHEDDERGPILLGGYAPVWPEAAQEPLKEIEGDRKSDQHEQEGEKDSGDDVAEDVVAHLVAEDQQDLVGGAFADGGIPDDDAF